MESIIPQIKIQVINVAPSQQPSGNGKTYSQLEVAFKNLTFQNKVEARIIRGFGANKAAYDALVNALSGQVFDVTTDKNDKGYIDWVSVVPGDANAPVARPASSSTPSPSYGSSPTAAPKSNYETPEERAKKQIYIVRQSSLSTAAGVLATGAKTAPDPKAIVEMAKVFEAYVFDSDKTFGDLENPDEFPDMPQ